MAGVDQRAGPDGSWTRFEVNPCPGVPFCEQTTERGIAGAVADELCSQSSRNWRRRNRKCSRNLGVVRITTPTLRFLVPYVVRPAFASGTFSIMLTWRRTITFGCLSLALCWGCSGEGQLGVAVELPAESEDLAPPPEALLQRELTAPEPDAAPHFEALTAAFLSARGNLEPGDAWAGAGFAARRASDGSLWLSEDVQFQAPHYSRGTAEGNSAERRQDELVHSIPLPLDDWWAFGVDTAIGVRFELNDAPPGFGELRLDLPVNGASLSLERANRVVAVNEDSAWLISELHAQDAAGRMLPVAFAVNDGALRIRVDDRGAMYPITVDPYISIYTWTETAALVPAAFHFGPPPQWGTAIATDGQRVLIGGVGQVDMYRRIPLRLGGHYYHREASFLPQSNSPGGAFGHDVAIDGDRIAVGGAGYENGGSIGYADVYVRNGTGWYHEDTVVPEGYDPDYTLTQFAFGRVVDLDGDTLVVGADRYWAARGAAFVYRRNGSSWDFEAFLDPPFDYNDSYFGKDVAVEGDRIAIGHSGLGHFSDHIGRVLVYRREPSGNWTLEATLFDPQSGPKDEFGNGLAFSGNDLAVSSNDGPRVFTRSGNTWSLTWQGPSLSVGKWFGFDFDGTRIASWEPDGVNVFRRGSSNFVFEQKVAHDNPYGVALGWPILAIGDPEAQVVTAFERKSIFILGSP